VKATESTNTFDVEENIERVRSGAHEAVDKAANATSHAANAMGEKSEQLKNAEQQFIKDCQVYINKNPITSIGIAVGAGFILSRLLSGR
jgi:ElaB/YqjD/DUF883 family membrane-anchored ribosome-binding protein